MLASSKDPLEDVFLQDADYWKLSDFTNLSFLKSVSALARFDKYFILGQSNEYLGNEIKNPVSLEDFNNGKVEGRISLWLNGGDQPNELLATWMGSTFKKKQLANAQLAQMKSIGSIAMAQYYMSQIDRELNNYFIAKNRMRITNPTHPALANTPNDISEINKVELLWLQYWNIAMQRRASKAFKIQKQKINYSERLHIASTDVPLEKKIFFSEVGAFDKEFITSHASLPIEWISELYNYNSVFTNRQEWLAMPETEPK